MKQANFFSAIFVQQGKRAASFGIFLPFFISKHNWCKSHNDARKHKNSRKVNHWHDMQGLFLVRDGLSQCLVADSQFEAEKYMYIWCLSKIFFSHLFNLPSPFEHVVSQTCVLDILCSCKHIQSTKYLLGGGYLDFALFTWITLLNLSPQGLINWKYHVIRTPLLLLYWWGGPMALDTWTIGSPFGREIKPSTRTSTRTFHSTKRDFPSYAAFN